MQRCSLCIYSAREPATVTVVVQLIYRYVLVPFLAGNVLGECRSTVAAVESRGPIRPIKNDRALGLGGAGRA